jgi:hypothetical protein
MEHHLEAMYPHISISKTAYPFPKSSLVNQLPEDRFLVALVVKVLLALYSF